MDIKETLHKQIVDSMRKLEVSEVPCHSQVIYDSYTKKLYNIDTVFLLASGQIRVLAYSDSETIKHTYILYKKELSLDFLDWLLGRIGKMLKQEQKQV